MFTYLSEIVTSTVLQNIFPYQNELAYFFYPIHITINIFEVIIISKDTYTPMDSKRNKCNAAALLLGLHDMNDK